MYCNPLVSHVKWKEVLLNVLVVSCELFLCVKDVIPVNSRVSNFYK